MRAHFVEARATRRARGRGRRVGRTVGAGCGRTATRRGGRLADGRWLACGGRSAGTGETRGAGVGRGLRNVRMRAREGARRAGWARTIDGRAPRVPGRRADVGGPAGRRRRAGAPVAVVAPVAFAIGTVDHPDAARGPVEIVGEPPTAGKAGAEGEQRRIPRGVARAREVDELRIVVGNENDLGLRGENPDVAALGDDLLLRRGEEVAGGERPGAQALDGVHHIIGLREEGFAELFGPREVLIHPADGVGVAGEGSDGVVPRLDVGAGRIVTHFEKTRGEHDLGGRGGRRQNEPDEGVWVEGDRAEEIVELLLGKQGDGGRRSGGGGRRFWRGLRNGEGRRNEQEAEELPEAGFHGGRFRPAPREGVPVDFWDGGAHG